MQKNLFKIAIICGGPSLERGISLNSARSVMDHLDGEEMEIIPFYLDIQKRPYKITKAQLYSNTPSDFDFKLKEMARPLSRTSFIKSLKKADIVFPIMHGRYGEDGGIERFLEKHNIPFVGSPSKVCRLAFDKYEANEFLRQNGFFALPTALLKIYHPDHRQIIKNFFEKNEMKRAVVKPANGGSSIGVFSVSNPKEALAKAELLFSKRMDTRVVVQPFAEGREFTVIILENRFHMPVAILPTEIETDYAAHQIFDFRKKYLPTNRVFYHCPPRFSDEVVEKIQVQAEQIFKLLGMRDFGRFDGWVLKNGQIWFADFNPISGMEQNSFLFQQTSRIGMSHHDTLRFIVRNACRRQGLFFPELKSPVVRKRKPINILFGGRTAERQVSLMSGTNVWLKLRRSDRYRPKPFLLDLDHAVWEIPYALALNHTVEEIVWNCRNAADSENRLRFLVEKIKLRLALEPFDAGEEFFIPRKRDLESFIADQRFLFIGLHGGIGEDGTIQNILETSGASFNGSDSAVSSLCMDKWLTKKRIQEFGIAGISVVPGRTYPISFFTNFTDSNFKKFWRRMIREFKAKSVAVKPLNDGSSSGVARLNSSIDLVQYLKFVENRASFIPKDSFRNQTNIIEMPVEPVSNLLFEKFIETDILRVRGNRLKYERRTGWIEITVGLLEEKGIIKAFNPSVTIAESEILTVEEKFQGGTGVNITPPPRSLVGIKTIERAKRSLTELARQLKIRGYARVDCFMNVLSGEIMVIEINALPALTPSTVLFHQALFEKEPLYPVKFLEKIIENKRY